MTDSMVAMQLEAPGEALRLVSRAMPRPGPSNRLLKTSFWCLNIGLAMMVFLSLFPQGLFQTYQSFTRDYAYARSAEVIHSPVMQALVWARVPGDLVFTVGVVAFAIFMVRALLRPGRSKDAAAAS